MARLSPSYILDLVKSVFQGTDGIRPGKPGLVPAPQVTETGMFLRSDSSWANPAGGPGVDTNLANTDMVVAGGIRFISLDTPTNTNLQIFTTDFTKAIIIGQNTVQLFASNPGAGTGANASADENDYTILVNGPAGLERCLQLNQNGVDLDITTPGELNINGDPGVAGQSLLSGGPDVPPAWGPGGLYATDGDIDVLRVATIDMDGAGQLAFTDAAFQRAVFITGTGISIVFTDTAASTTIGTGSNLARMFVSAIAPATSNSRMECTATTAEVSLRDTAYNNRWRATANRMECARLNLTNGDFNGIRAEDTFVELLCGSSSGAVEFQINADAGTAGQNLTSNGAGASPTWEEGLPLSPNTGDMVYWNGSSWTQIPIGANGTTLTVVAGVPTWV